MRKTALALLFCYIFLTATSHCAEMTIDASTSIEPVNARLFGHNTVYLNGIEHLWDGSTGASGVRR